MGTASFGSNAVRTGYTAGGCHTNSSISTALGRATASGIHPIIMTALFGAISGKGATRSLEMYLGGCAVAFSVASGGSAADTGNLSADTWYVANGGSGQFGYTGLSGQCYFGRSSTSGASDITGDFGTFTGTLGGAYAYVESPGQMLAPTLSSPAPGEVDLTWTAPDNGGTAISGYRIQRATDAAFTLGLTNIDVGAVLSYADTTVLPGAVYYYRIAAKNAVTTAASSTAVFSPSANVTVKAGGHRWTGSAEVQTSTAVRWDGADEVPIATAVRWNGTAEVALS